MSSTTPRIAVLVLTVIAAASGLAAAAPAAQAEGESLSFLKDLRPGSGDSGFSDTFDRDGTLFFEANDGVGGDELWTTDGTAAGTALVKDIRPGPTGSDPAQMRAIGDTVIFVANDGTNGVELWRSDGTAAGTLLLKDIAPGAGSSNPQELTRLGSKIFFSASDGTNGRELWSTDGSPAGTKMVIDIRSGSSASSPSVLTAAGNRLFFSANDGTRGTELWRSDGTAAGTDITRDVHPAGNNIINAMIAVGNDVLLGMSDGTNGIELWRSDGTAGGTNMIKDIAPGPGDGEPYGFSAAGGVVFFAASTPATGFELYRTDGTGAGTTPLKDIQPGAASSAPRYLTAAGSRLYFVADGPEGLELWTSDGTPAGTKIVKDINPGSDSSFPESLTALNGKLVFLAKDAGGLFDVYESDSTSAGTIQISDDANGSGDPTTMTRFGRTVIAERFDPSHGFEPWVGRPIVEPLSPGLLLPSTPVGETSDSATIEFRNAGLAPLHVSKIRIFGDHPAEFDVVHETCTDISVTPGFGCSIDLVFHPKATGLRLADLTLYTDETSQSTYVPIGGNATAAADTTPPETQITSGPTGTTTDTTPTFGFSSNEAGSTFQCRTDGGAWGACTSPVTLPEQSLGPHGFEVRAIDPAANPDPTPAIRNFAVAAASTEPAAADTTPPDVYFTSGPAGLTNDATPSFGFAMSEAGTFYCRVDGAQFAACSSPNTTPALSQGPHTFEVRAIDAAGNMATVAREILVDTASPQTSLAPVPKQVKAKKKAKLSFSSQPPSPEQPSAARSTAAPSRPATRRWLPASAREGTPSQSRRPTRRPTQTRRPPPPRSR